MIAILKKENYDSLSSFVHPAFKPYCWFLAVLAFLWLLAGNAKLFAQTYSGPLVITKGGTYTGNWESRDSEVAAVEIRTNEPVVIVNSNIRGAGPLVRSLGNSADITIRHTKGYGLTPTPWRDYKKARRFLGVDVFRNIVVENCYMENTAGIYIGQRYEGNGSTSNTIKIRYNVAKNIDGRVYGGQTFAQFVQFNYRNAAPHVEVAWNQVINEPGNSAVEDNISIYNSRGTSASPIRIHNNYIFGAYPIPYNSQTYSGGGIITDGDGDINSCPAYIEAHSNQLVNLGNYSMGIAGGNNIRYHHNRAVNSAIFKDGSKFAMYTSGLWSKDYYRKNTTFSNSVDNNTVGVTAWGYPNERNDISVAENASFADNAFLAGGAIAVATEAAEYTLWMQKLVQNGIVLGPVEAITPPPVVTGKITREYWANINGSNVSEIPVNTIPTRVTELTSFEAPSNVADNYGQRVRGYITAPQTGKYTFWIASDDKGELWLSTSEDPTDVVKIAYTNRATKPREWTKYSTQQSVKVTLQAGKRYYIEALMKERTKNDNLAVGWQLPDGKLERPIPGNRLSLYLGETSPAPLTYTLSVTVNGSGTVSTSGGSYPSGTNLQLTATPASGYTFSGWSGSASGSANPLSLSMDNDKTVTANFIKNIEPPQTSTGKISREYWAGVTGYGISSIPLSSTPTLTNELTIFEAPTDIGDNYGTRVRGCVTAPATGQYTFWISGDNDVELWLSSSEAPGVKQRIAYMYNGWTNPREWTKYSTQQSMKVTLQAGQKYYIEALHKEEAGGDNMAVGWQLPDGTLERPIPGNRLSPYLQATSTQAITMASETAEREEVTVYPNPFKQEVSVILKNGTTLKSVELYDLTGRLLYNSPDDLGTESEVYTLKIGQELERGVYFLRVMDNQQNLKSIKIVKE